MKPKAGLSRGAGCPGHVGWLVRTGQVLKTNDGQPVEVMELRHTKDGAILSEWARHFRNQYCADSQIDALRQGTKYSRSEYLREIKFPDEHARPGPSIRAGDFGEILVADYLEYCLGYTLPRWRYNDKSTRDESTRGTDVIGFKILDSGINDPNDALALFETKAQLTRSTPNRRLQDAVDGSAKDEVRKAESLNAIKQRFLDRNQFAEMKMVERFQNPEDFPYSEVYGAVALLSSAVYDVNAVCQTTTTSHPRAGDLTLLVIHGPDLMELVRELYRRAADEADAEIQ